MITARGVLRALICSGAAALATLAVLQAGFLAAPPVPEGARLASETLSLGERPPGQGLSLGRALLVMLPLLWALAILWGALATWVLRRLRNQSLVTYLGAGLLCGGGLGLFGAGSIQAMLGTPIPPARAGLVIAAFAAGWMVGLGSYWRMRRTAIRS
jgi:hypothetical protein